MSSATVKRLHEVPPATKRSAFDHDAATSRLAAWASADDDRDADVLPTRQLRFITAACQFCWEKGELGLVTGLSGVGKTTALREFARSHREEQDVVMLTARREMNVRDLADEIGASLRLCLFGSPHQRIRRIAEALGDRRYSLGQHRHLIMVDEAENLVNRSIDKVETLRALHDDAGVGVVLCGTPQLESLILRGPNRKDTLSQLHSRIGLHWRVPPVEPEDIAAFLEGIRLNDTARRLLTEYAIDVQRGGMRMFVKVLKRSLDLMQAAERQEITGELVKQAVRMLFV